MRLWVTRKSELFTWFKLLFIFERLKRFTKQDPRFLFLPLATFLFALHFPLYTVVFFYREIIPLCNPANPHFGHCERWTVASVSLPPFPSPTAIWQHRPRIFANSSLCIDIKKCFVPSLQTFWCCSLSFAFLSYQLFTQSLKLPIWILAPLKVASVLWCMWEQV